MIETAKREKPYHHGNLRRALIDAALELISAEGTGPVSLREAARRVGVTHTAPYRHFASKEALLAAVAAEGFEGLRSAMLARMELAGDDLVARLQQSGVGYVLFAVAHPSHFRVMFGADLVGQGAYPSLTKAGEEAFAVLVGAIVACQAAGAVRAAQPLELALAAWSLTHGLATLLVDGQLKGFGYGPDQAEALASAVTGVMQLGLA